MTHDEIVAEIQAQAKARGVLTHYCGSAERCHGDRGLPDLLLVGDYHLGWIEVKLPGDKLKPDQVTWYYKLRASGQLYERMGPDDLAEGGGVDLFLGFLTEG